MKPIYQKGYREAYPPTKQKTPEDDKCPTCGLKKGTNINCPTCYRYRRFETELEEAIERIASNVNDWDCIK